MSDSDNPPNPLESLLSEFSLGPAWARAKSDSKENSFREVSEKEFKPRRDDDRRGGGERNNRRDAGFRDDRRQGGGGSGGGGGYGGASRNRFDPDRGRPPFQQHEEIPPAEGVNVSLVPEKSAIRLVCKEIQQVARVYPLYDIAEIILAERSRSRAIFEISQKKESFFRCIIEDAIFLTKEEAVRHLLAADWRDRFIEESTVEIDPPKGNFQSVARCGISGVLLGPPNHHEYQSNLRRIHRERFANMPFEAYSAKVRTERTEEAVNEWLDSMKLQTRWRILSSGEIATAAAARSEIEARRKSASSPPTASHVASNQISEETEALGPIAEDASPAAIESEPPPATATTESLQEESPPSEAPEEISGTLHEDSPEDSSPETPEPSPDDSPPPGETPETSTAEPSPEEVKWFTDRAELERALGSEVLDHAFETTRKASVSAGIPGKQLSPGLLVRLKGTGNHHRKHPAIVIPVVCKILEAEHMPVFKRKGKLYTGPARPKPLALDAILAPRPAEMVAWIRNNPPAKLEGLWKSVLPDGSTAPPAEYAADLFWLLQQGHILLYTDDTLVVQEKPPAQQPKKNPAEKASPDKPETEGPLEPSPASQQEVPQMAEPSAAPSFPSPLEHADGLADTVTGLIGTPEEDSETIPPPDPSSPETQSHPPTPPEVVQDATIASTAPEAPAPGLEMPSPDPEANPTESSQPPASDTTITTHPEASSHNSPALPPPSEPLPPKSPEHPAESPAADSADR